MRYHGFTGAIQPQQRDSAVAHEAAWNNDDASVPRRSVVRNRTKRARRPREESRKIQVLNVVERDDGGHAEPGNRNGERVVDEIYPFEACGNATPTNGSDQEAIPRSERRRTSQVVGNDDGRKSLARRRGG